MLHGWLPPRPQLGGAAEACGLLSQGCVTHDARRNAASAAPSTHAGEDLALSAADVLSLRVGEQPCVVEEASEAELTARCELPPEGVTWLEARLELVTASGAFGANGPRPPLATGRGALVSC